MEFREGSPVYTWDDRDVGRIARVVLNPTTKAVTHVVVHKGFLFTEDKVVPIDFFSTANEDRAVLRKDTGDLKDLPRFEEAHYVPIDISDEPGVPAEVSEGLLWYPPIGMAPYQDMAFHGMSDMVVKHPGEGDQPYRERIEQNIPEGTVALKEGAKVISADGKHVGNVDEVIVDPESDYVTHVVVSHGLMLKHRKLVPILWIGTVGQDEIYLSVRHDLLDSLPNYEHAIA